jgi:integrase
MNGSVRPISGHVFRVDGKRGARWYAKYRLPDGRQVQKALGPAWTQRGRPAQGWFTKRTAEAWLRDVLDQAHRGTLPGMVRTGATFADAAAEWRWRDVDFSAQTVRVTASYTVGKLGTPKSGLGRAVPLVQEAAEALARLGNRERWAGPDDLVFVGQAGEYLDGSALRRRFKRARDAAGLRPLRFHDLRHTFGSVAIRTVDPRELQEWMGHSDFSTTQI